MVDTVIEINEDERLQRWMDARTTEQLEQEYINLEEQAIRLALDENEATDSECREHAYKLSKRKLENLMEKLRRFEQEDQNDEYFDGFSTEEEIRRRTVEFELEGFHCLGLNRSSEVLKEVFDAKRRSGDLFSLPERSGDPHPYL